MTGETGLEVPLEDLIGNLRFMVEQLWVECQPQLPGKPNLPNNEYLEELRHRVLRLANRLRKPRDRFSTSWSALRFVANKFPEWRMEELIVTWIDVFSAVPKSPQERWKERLTAIAPARDSVIKSLLVDLGNCQLPPLDLVCRLHPHWPVIFTLASDEFKGRYQCGNFRPISTNPDSHAVKSELFARWGLVTDLLAQQVDWSSRYGRFSWFPRWVAQWQNDDLTAKIQDHLPQNPHPSRDRVAARRRLVSGRRRIERHRGSGGFEKGDILDLGGFAMTLRLASDPVAALVVSRMSAESRQALASMGSGSSNPKELESWLLQELTRICSGPCIYDSERFGHVPLRPETKTRLSSREIQSSDYQAIKLGALEDASAVAAALKSPTTKASEFLWERLRTGTREALDNWDGKSDLPMKTKKAMLHDLNAVILGPSFWDVAQFDEVPVPSHVQVWLDCEVSGPQVAQLNRLLIDQLLPLNRWKGNLPVPLPNAVRFRKSLFRLNRILIEDAFVSHIRRTAGSVGAGR